ncbi:hypothetical protein HPB50_005281 [Hyalomma asiaticum]|uniref:Uncharacterized protein n=1 Tax=Hyalomma asiaticum TaxID=266040 RepID=A0ACB7T347_HYAAI|nr:hypothetical protein HPB50_005281 [Hyalomma asiaticum]
MTTKEFGVAPKRRTKFLLRSRLFRSRRGGTAFFSAGGDGSGVSSRTRLARFCSPGETMRREVAGFAPSLGSWSARLASLPPQRKGEANESYKFDRRIKDAPRKLRRGATSHEEGLAIVAAVADNPRCSAQEIKVNLGLKASKSTVKRRQAGLKSRTAEQKVLLRTDNKDKRLQFAQRHAGWIEQDWKKVIFTDESTFTTCWEQKTRIRRPDCTL